LDEPIGSPGIIESFSYHLPFGTKTACIREIMAADLNKLANPVRIFGFLMQTKTYLLWKERGSENAELLSKPSNLMQAEWMK